MLLGQVDGVSDVALGPELPTCLDGLGLVLMALVEIPIEAACGEDDGAVGLDPLLLAVPLDDDADDLVTLEDEVDEGGWSSRGEPLPCERRR